MQKTAYGVRISDWSADVCSADLGRGQDVGRLLGAQAGIAQTGGERLGLEGLLEDRHEAVVLSGADDDHRWLTGQCGRVDVVVLHGPPGRGAVGSLVRTDLDVDHLGDAPQGSDTRTASCRARA